MVGYRAFAEPRPHTIRLIVQTGITNFKLKTGCNSGRQVFRSWRTKNLRIPLRRFAPKGDDGP